MKFSFTPEVKILLVCLIIALFLIVVGIISGDLGVLGNTVILSIFIVAVPQFFLTYEKYKTLKEIELQFPVFLRDVIESVRAGMPLHQAIITNSNIDYGKFSKDVKKMANQITWGLTLDKVLDQLAEKVKKSRKLRVAIQTIKETYFAGGDVVSMLESVANTLLVLEESEKEKKSLLNQYVVMMYALSFVFIGIVAAINKLMVPIFEASSVAGAEEVMGMSNPCNTCLGFGCVVCDLYGTVAKIFNIDPSSIGAYYVALFFFMSIIQSSFAGLVAGQISENSIFAGLKHSLILLSASFAIFSILIRMKLLGV